MIGVCRAFRLLRSSGCGGNPTGLFRATATPRESCDSAVAAWAWPVPIRGTANLEVATTPEALPMRRTGLGAAS